MFGKLMNGFYYGKSGKGDFRKEDLPTNRWQLFGEMLRIRLSGLMRLNLIYALIWLPVMVLFMICVSGVVGEMNMALQEGLDLTGLQDKLVDKYLQLFVYGLIPCLLITGPFTAGVAYVTRNWARDEHAFVWADFKDAVKDNWKQALGVSAITCVVPVVVGICWNFYSSVARQMNMPFLAIAQVLAVTAGVVWAMMLIYLYPLMVSYKLTFKQLLRNAALLAVGRLPHNIALRLALLLPLMIAAVAQALTGQILWVAFGLFMYYMLIGLALSRFASASFTNGVFDRYINVKIEGAQVNRGLNPEAQEEDEDDLDDDEE